MLKLSLSAVERGEAHLREEVPPDHPLWEGIDAAPSSPLEVDLRAHPVGEGLLVRGTLRGRVRIPCRRCLAAGEHDLDETVDFFFQDVGEEAEELEGEVYPLPAKGDEVDLADAVRERLLLHVPRFVVCREECRGLCPRCGANLNEAACDCAPEAEPGPWDALKDLEFD